MYPVNRSEDGTRDLLNWDHEKINFDQFNVDFPINSSKRRQNDLPTADLISLMNGKKSELDTVEAMLNVPSDPDTKRALQSEKNALTRSLRRGDTEIWRRRAMALAVLSFALLGSPLALLLRTNQRLVPFFFAVLAVLAVFYPLTYGGIQLSRATGAPAWITVLSGNYALILVSLGLIFRLRLR
jgi:lipopolysaccharide export LptBFGC system permease protein LptF